MPSIQLSRVSFAYDTSPPLIEDLDLRLSPGWHGVVGANGAGKTTLLQLLSGALEPEQGVVVFHGLGSRPGVAYCPQIIDRAGAAERALADSRRSGARRWAGRLHLDPDALVRWPTLSPGERKRWQIGAALASEPAVLLLDEPTNHLDARARSLLLEALRDFSGIGLVVSHDRALLDSLTQMTLRVVEGHVAVLRGSYSVARSTWEAEEEFTRNARAKVRDQQRKLERRLRDRQQKKAQSMAALRTSKHMRGRSPKDNAARNAFKANRRRSKDVSLGREIQKTHGRLDRVGRELDTLRVRTDLGRSLFVDFEPAPVRDIMSVDSSVLRVGDRVLAERIGVSVHRDSRIRVAGPNGVGKTTLVRALLEGRHVDASKLLYLPQELAEHETIELLDRVRALDEEIRGRVMSLVAALGVAPESLLASPRPSPGEARKLALADGLGRQVWGLVLDEPTNHMDLPAIERLEEALVAYPGALLLVTHDDTFAKRCVSTRWDFVDGALLQRSEGCG